MQTPHSTFIVRVSINLYYIVSITHILQCLQLPGTHFSHLFYVKLLIYLLFDIYTLILSMQYYYYVHNISYNTRLFICVDGRI
jgi:hypothetical protein